MLQECTQRWAAGKEGDKEGGLGRSASGRSSEDLTDVVGLVGFLISECINLGLFKANAALGDTVLNQQLFANPSEISVRRVCELRWHPDAVSNKKVYYEMEPKITWLDKA